MNWSSEIIKPGVGAVVHADAAATKDPAFADYCLDLLYKQGALILPQINLTDEEQLEFNDRLGSRVNFTDNIAGGNEAAKDVYTITLDPKVNTEPEYVLGTFFWHIDGMCSPIAPPKFTVLSCRKAPDKGGQTEFANTYAAFEALPEEEQKYLESLRVLHSVTAAVREVASPDEIKDAVKRGAQHERPLVYTNPDSGRKCLLVGYSADYIVGMSKPEGRALIARLTEWAAQPAFSLMHSWTEGDMAIWDNCGVLHRARPYSSDTGRRMHRTSVAGVEAEAAA